MRRRSSKNIRDTERLKVKEEPHLSGAYIRSLVKQLTSSRTKDPMNEKAPDSGDGDGFHQNLPNFSEGFIETQPQPPPCQPLQPKKQVRRRLHTSRPYQERLLNMAEARREIVTALKFHRAAMKRANEKQQQQESQPQPQPQPSLEPNERMKARRNPRIYPSNHTNPTTSTFSNYINSIPFTSFPPPPPCTYSWTSPVAPLPISENLELALPNQPLGLNLNLHDFNNIDTSFYHSKNENPSVYSASSSSSSSPNFSCTEVPLATNMSPPNGGLHPWMGDEEMAEIRTLGEQHVMEWNDTLNLVTSAWWLKFLKNMEIRPEISEERGDEDGFHMFDEAMHIPAWLNDGVVGNASENCFQQHLDDSYSDWLRDSGLPCMDIGEIEGMDGEWLS